MTAGESPGFSLPKVKNISVCLIFILRSKLASCARENSLWIQQVLRQRNFVIVWAGSGKRCQVQHFVPNLNLPRTRGPELKSVQLRIRALMACFSSKAQDHSSHTELEDGEKKDGLLEHTGG